MIAVEKAKGSQVPASGERDQLDDAIAEPHSIAFFPSHRFAKFLPGKSFWRILLLLHR